MTGGGCVIPDFGILQMARSRARARFWCSKKSQDYYNGGMMNRRGNGGSQRRSQLRLDDVLSDSMSYLTWQDRVVYCAHLEPGENREGSERWKSADVAILRRQQGQHRHAGTRAPPPAAGWGCRVERSKSCEFEEVSERLIALQATCWCCAYGE